METAPEPPRPIECSSTVLDVLCHSSLPFVCTALVSGNLEFYKLTPETNQFSQVASLTNTHRGESSRTISLCESQNQLFSGGGDGSLVCIDTTTGQVVWKRKTAHNGVPVSRVHCRTNVPFQVFSGDENGQMHLWDLRQSTTSKASMCTFPHPHSDFVSEFCELDETDLLTTGGDGTLRLFDLRKSSVKMRSKSVELESELLSVLTLKAGKRVVVGTQEGTLLEFDRAVGEFPLNSHPGHPSSIDCMLRVNDTRILTGSSDGMIRIVDVFPKYKLLGVIGFHDDFPVERMTYCLPDRSLLATCSHDELVRFWDLTFLLQEDFHTSMQGNHSKHKDEEDDDDDDDDGDDDMEQEESAALDRTFNPSKRKRNTFFDDL